MNKKSMSILIIITLLVGSVFVSLGARKVSGNTLTRDANPLRTIDTFTWYCIYFGSYPQSSNGNGGFKTERIKWRVLWVQGDDAFIMADEALDCKAYNEQLSSGVKWHNSTIRSWLNGYNSTYNKSGIDYSNNNFIDMAFTDEEKSIIKDTTVTDSGNTKHNINGGEDTQDKVFLLSMNEVTTEKYGFYKSDISTSDCNRVCKATDYAVSKGCYTQITSYGPESYCGWWLRSPGKSSSLESYIFGGGGFADGYNMDNSYTYYGGHAPNGIRPAMHIKASSELFSQAPRQRAVPITTTAKPTTTAAPTTTPVPTTKAPTSYSLNKYTGVLRINEQSALSGNDSGVMLWNDDKNYIKKVVISPGITSIGKKCFYELPNLETVELPNSVTKIDEYAFAYCSNLSSINIPESVTHIGNYAFYNCQSLKSIELPSKVQHLGVGVFSGCSNLETATIKYKPETIPASLFYRCSSLKNFSIPSSVKKIDKNAFLGCTSFVNLVIPSGVTGIGDGAYRYCSNIKTVTVPLSLVWIGDYAFAGCNSIVETNYLGDKNDWNFIYMGSNNEKLISALRFHTCKFTKTIIVKPTYSKKGYTIHICEVCGKKHIDSYVDVLKNTQIKKIKRKKKALKVSWRKTYGVAGYSLQYSLNKKFKKAKTILINKVSTTTKTIKKLKSRKKYYLRIRTYVIQNKKPVYSSWSKVKSKKTK